MTNSDRIDRVESLLRDLDADAIESGMTEDDVEFLRPTLQAALIGLRPIPMLLFCPRCDAQHIDKIQPEKHWANPPHHSHLCGLCGHIWRPADVPTTGVAVIETKGSADGDPSPQHVNTSRRSAS